MRRFLMYGPALVLCTLLLGGVAMAADVPDYLPEAEKSIADSVDPWGLAFSDALTRYEQRFAGSVDAPFVMGLNHDLVKVWPTKYWYRGPSWAPGSAEPRVGPLLAAAGEVQSLQLVALPRVGAAEAAYALSVELENGGGATATVFREVFVRTSPGAAYPRFHSERWPDPLVPESEVTVGGMDCGVFWVDIDIPPDHPGGEIACHVRLTSADQTARAAVGVQVVPGLDLDPKGYPFVGWFGRRYADKQLTDEQYRGMCELVLRHHLQPVDALSGLWSADDPAAFDAMHGFLAERGQRFFDLRGVKPEDRDAAYAHIKQAGWLDRCLIYNDPDEPDDEAFATQNIANNQEIHRRYPGIRTYLASEYHEYMDRGCDIWLTDVSASRYDPDQHRNLQAPELWHYYCHLPVRWQMRAPLVGAPNMQIDNPAIEHRLALWMSYHYGAKGVFIWAGFRPSGMRPDFWETLQLSDKPSGYPYAGVHNGNNFRVYPPREPDGPVLPSIRLKITRDALEDIALMRLARELVEAGDLPGERREQLEALLDPTPEVFVDFHYFSRDPTALLSRRDVLLRALAEARG